MEMMMAVRAHKRGGPEVLRYEEAPRPVAGNGQVGVVNLFAREGWSRRATRVYADWLDLSATLQPE